MFDIGNVFGSIAKAVLPNVLAADFPVEPDPAHEPTHQASLGSQPLGPTAPIADHLSSYVATNGLHSVARQ